MKRFQVTIVNQDTGRADIFYPAATSHAVALSRAMKRAHARREILTKKAYFPTTASQFNLYIREVR